MLSKHCYLCRLNLHKGKLVITSARSKLAWAFGLLTEVPMRFLRFHTASVDSTSSQLARAAVQVVWRTAIQPVSGLKGTADIRPDSRSTSGIGGSRHKLAKAQRLQPA